ncbi:MAG: O-succinylbenzoate synthase [Verrucomicrobiales bacterium]|jgi:O-succinylbenzoate synthase
MIEFWRYVLQPSAALNARSGHAPCEGALLRIDGGHGCVHPWPALGDLSLDQQLSRLADGRPTFQTSRALYCCSIDGAARKEHRSLFHGLEIPKSHVIVVDAAHLGLRAPEFHAEGFDTVKVKVGRDIDREATLINAFAAEWIARHPGHKIRLDFNASIAPADVLIFAAALSRAARGSIDFIEDPCPYAAGTWHALQQKTGLTFALDRDEEQHRTGAAIPIRVWKPACSPAPPASSSARLVVTSYMDHAIGQMFAAYEAARFPGKLETCGLLTHSLFECDGFFDSLRVSDARLVQQQGHGLGFDGMLSALPWKSLKT